MAEMIVQLIGLILFGVGLWVIATLLGAGIATVIHRAWNRFHG
jgi:hypothetical protein